MKYITFILLASLCSGFTLDVNIPLKVERDSITIEYHPSGIYYVGYFNGKLLRFTEDQYYLAIGKGAEFPTDAMAPPNVWKGETVMNGYSYDYDPGDTLIIQDDGVNYYLRLIKSPSIALVQPVGQDYTFGTALNIVFIPEFDFDFTGEMDVVVNGESIGMLNSEPYSMLWTPDKLGKYVIHGSFYNDGRLKETNAIFIEVTGEPIILDPTLIIEPDNLTVGGSAVATLNVSNPDDVLSTEFYVDGEMALGGLDMFLANVIFDNAGTSEVYVRVEAMDGGIFETERQTVLVNDVPLPPSYALPFIDFPIEYQTEDFLVKAMGDNASKGEGIDKLFDESVGTKWLIFLGGVFSTTMDFVWDNEVTISGLALSSANDASRRDPILLGVINGDTGESFSVEGLPTDALRRSSYGVTFPAPVTASSLRFVLTNHDYGHSMQMSGLSFVYQ